MKTTLIAIGEFLFMSAGIAAMIGWPFIIKML